MFFSISGIPYTNYTTFTTCTTCTTYTTYTNYTTNNKYTKLYSTSQGYSTIFMYYFVFSNIYLVSIYVR